MSARIGLVHATLAAVEPMVAAFRQYAPDVALLHFLDEGLLPMVDRDGLTSTAIGELERLVRRAAASGTDAILLTCSAFSPTVSDLQRRLPLPVVSVDEAMLREAVGLGATIGVIATVEAAGPTTARLLRDHALGAGRDVDVQVRVVPEAFAALKAGDAARHDELVRDRIDELMPSCDAIVLAQISMARAVAGEPSFEKPVLTSPQASIRAVLARLASTGP